LINSTILIKATAGRWLFLY